MPYTEAFAAAEPPREMIDTRPGPLVLEFGAPWCGYCRAAAPLIKEAFAAFPQVDHLRIEDGPGRPLGRSFRVKLWPTLIFLDSGKEVARLIRPADVASIREALQQLASPR
jgi:thioredoxin 1